MEFAKTYGYKIILVEHQNYYPDISFVKEGDESIKSCKKIKSEDNQMPSTGDSFITILKKVHLEWDTYRHKSSRDLIYGEEYLQIPENSKTVSDI